MVSVPLLVCALARVALVPEYVAAQGVPACPNSWPVQAYDGPLLEQDYGRIAYQDLFTDSDGEDWFVVRSSDSNGYTTGRAYRTGDYGDGYVAGSPDEICYMVLRRPGDVADTGVHSTDGHETDHSQIVPQLRENAEAFEYTIGKQGGSPTYTTIGGPLTFNLALANDSSSSGVLGYLFEVLTEVSWLTGRVEPGLAEQWEHSADGLTWTFYLRREVQWQDGEEFTAEDVVFTFNRIIYNDDIDTSNRAAFNFRILDQTTGERREEPMTVTALDDHTVQFHLPAPFAPFLRSTGTVIYPKHILEPYVAAGTFGQVWDIDTDPKEVIGTGPFTISSYVPSERVVLSRNPNYWLKDDEGNGLPYLDEVVRLIVPDLEAELTKFRAGESDIHGVLGEEFETLEPIQQAEDFTIHELGPGFGTTFLTFNTNPEQNADTGEPYVPLSS